MYCRKNSVLEKRVYCISGLGADERIFDKLYLPGIDMNYVKWLKPSTNEPIGDYAKRMCDTLIDLRPSPSLPIVLIGVSFGGMMAIEMAKFLPEPAVILISSVKSRKELPWATKLAGKLGLYKLISTRPGSYRFLRRLIHHFLGVETPEEGRLSDEFNEHVDPFYLRWAIEKIVCWKNKWQPPVLYHIHGSRDRSFPLKGVAATHIVDGGHFIVMNRAKEISAILSAVLGNIFDGPATNGR